MMVLELLKIETTAHESIEVMESFYRISVGSASVPRFSNFVAEMFEHMQTNSMAWRAVAGNRRLPRRNRSQSFPALNDRVKKELSRILDRVADPSGWNRVGVAPKDLRPFITSVLKSREARDSHLTYVDSYHWRSRDQGTDEATVVTFRAPGSFSIRRNIRKHLRSKLDEFLKTRVGKRVDATLADIQLTVLKTD